MVKFTKKRIFIIIGIIFAVFFLYKYFFPGSTALGNSGSNNKTKSIVEKKNVKLTLTLSGKIAADEYISLRFQSSGKLTWVGVKKGDVVHKNQTLATLDHREIQKNLEKKLNTYLTNRWDFEQTQDDNNVHGRKMSDLILTDAEKRILEKSQFDLNNSILDVEIQNLALEYANLSTPINGIVTRIDTPYSGVNITPAGAVFEITNPESVYLSVSADQNEVINIKSGMKTEILMDSYPNEKLVGTVDNISFNPKTDESNTVYEVKVKLPNGNPDYKYRIDMTADAIFTIKNKQNVLSVPTQFVKQDGEEKYVYIMKNNQKIKNPIKTGDEFDNDTEILSGLSEGEFIYD
jgi:membrane fusion protein, multidrug efflux system